MNKFFLKTTKTEITVHTESNTFRRAYLLHCDTLHVVDAVVCLVEVFGDSRVPVFLMMFEWYW